MTRQSALEAQLQIHRLITYFSEHIGILEKNLAHKEDIIRAQNLTLKDLQQRYHAAVGSRYAPEQDPGRIGLLPDTTQANNLDLTSSQLRLNEQLQLELQQLQQLQLEQLDRKAITDLESLAGRLQQQAKEQQEAIKSRDSDVRRLTALQEQLTQQLDQQNADMAGQGAIVADLSGAEARLEQEVHDQKAELSRTEDAIAGNGRVIAGLTRAKGLLEQQVGAQTAELASNDTLIADLTSTKEQLELQVRQLLEDAGGKAEEMANLSSIKAKLEQQLTEQNEAIECLSECLFFFVSIFFRFFLHLCTPALCRGVHHACGRSPAPRSLPAGGGWPFSRPHP